MGLEVAPRNPVRIRTASILLVQLCTALTVRASDFFVSPDGSPFANGSMTRPWDLQTALKHPASIRDGDTIWVRGGVYSPRSAYATGFRSYLSGETRAPITVRQYPGERAILTEGVKYKGSEPQAVLSVMGSNSRFWGLEITSANPTRTISVPGPNPSPAVLPLASGVEVSGAGTKLINLIIHDARGGLGIWEAATNSEVYGCIIYNNGWMGANGGHGPGIYCQNRSGDRRLTDNIVFNQFSTGINGYTVRSFLDNITVERNVVFNNAHISDASKDTGAQILFGGETRIQHLRIIDNFTFQPLDLHGPSVMTDYGAVSNRDVVITGNYIAGGSGGGNYLVSAMRYESVVFSNNTLYSTNGFLVNLEPRPKVGADSNSYFGNEYKNLGLVTTNGMTQLDFAEWQTATGFDSHSRYFQSVPPPNKIVVNPNAYEPKRATIVAYNWSGADEIAVDVHNVLTNGDQFVVRNAQDFFAAPVLTGTYAGTPLILPMTNLTTAIPNGWANTNAIPRTGTQFNVFVLIGPSIRPTSGKK
jgi:hypothetical protein